MNKPAQAIHTVFGAGQVGLKLADELLGRGHQVRLVRRGPPGPARPGLTWITGDVTDRQVADQAAAGAAVVYNCVNPPDYARWDGVLEPLARSVRNAAARASARLVVLDCLYMYGAPEAVPFDEDTPMRPCSHKGELRRQLVEELFDAHRRGEVEVTTGRASDYFGPATPLSMLFHPRALARLSAGKPVEVLGNPDTAHAYHYTPDVARALAELGTHPQAVGKAFHLPAAWTGTSRELVARFGAALGQAGTIRVIPPWLTRTLGVVSPTMRAIGEMLYQWDQPYVPDDRRFRSTFRIEPTPIDEAIRETLASRCSGHVAVAEIGAAPRGPQEAIAR